MVRRAVTAILVAGLLSACGSAATPSPPLASSVASAAATPSSATSTPAASPSAAPSPTVGPDAWLLVAIGDSIPFNSPNDCPGCVGFVDRYAAAIRAKTGHEVVVQNLSKHNGLQVDGLLTDLASDPSRKTALSDADIIIVGIAHNDVPMNRNDDPCDGPNGDNPDWSKYTKACIAKAAAIFKPKYESVFQQISEMRAGKPTILRAINRYNDWIGWPGGSLSPEGVTATKLVVDAWSDTICTAAKANGFVCADIYTAFNGPDGLTASGDLVASDYTHPSDKGNEVIADTLIKLGYAPLVP